LGEKVNQLDGRQEKRCTQMMGQLQQELASKEEMLTKLQEVQVIKEEAKPSISRIDACTITKGNVVSTSSENL
jgi:hypothetical protein